MVAVPTRDGHCDARDLSHYISGFLSHYILRLSHYIRCSVFVFAPLAAAARAATPVPCLEVDGPTWRPRQDVRRTRTRRQRLRPVVGAKSQRPPWRLLLKQRGMARLRPSQCCQSRRKGRQPQAEVGLRWLGTSLKHLTRSSSSTQSSTRPTMLSTTRYSKIHNRCLQQARMSPSCRTWHQQLWSV